MNEPERIEKELWRRELKEIQQKMLGLLDEAAEIVNQNEPFGESGMGGARARRYWIPGIRSLLNYNQGNPYDTSMQSTIDELLKEEGQEA